MRAVPKCSVKLTEYLEDLRKKEDLELLREPIKEHGLFPEDADTDKTPITIEELKNLVRIWKLNWSPGFWKMNPLKEDLVNALLEYREEVLHLPRNPVKPAGARPSRLDARKQLPGSADYRINSMRDYGGDLFGRHPVTHGMVYQSRQMVSDDAFEDGLVYKSRQNETADAPRGPLSPSLQQGRRTMSPASKSSGNGELLSTAPGSPEEVSDPGPSTYPSVLVADDIPPAPAADDVPTNDYEVRLSVASQVYDFSLEPGNELKVVKEGALPALMNMSKTSDPVILSYAAAALCNLACAPEVRTLMLEAGIVPEAEKLVLSTTGDLQACWALLICHLSVERHAESQMLPGALQAFQALSAVGLEKHAGEPLHQMATLVAMGNLVCGEENESVIELCLSACKPLLSSDTEIPWVIMTQALQNCALFERTLPLLVDSGTVPIMAKLVTSKFIKTFSPNALKAVCRCVAKTMCNMSNASEVRKYMLKDGAVTVLARVLAMDDTPAVLELCAMALMNLTSINANHKGMVIINGAVDALVRLAEIIHSPDALAKVATGLCELTEVTESLETMVQKGAHTALIGMLNTLTLPNDQEYALCGLCNLLGDAANHRPVVEAGIMAELEKLAKASESKKIKGLCAKILSNLTPSLESYAIETHILILSVLSALTADADAEMKAICSAAFASFASVPDEAVLAQMIEFKIPASMLVLLKKGNEGELVMQQCAATFTSLTRCVPFHERLYEQGCMEALNKLAGEGSVDTQQRCATALKYLSQTPQDINGLVEALVTLQHRATDQTVLKVCAEAIFTLSCDSNCRKVLCENAVIQQELLSSMRGGLMQTQLCSARALCNISCEPECAKVLLGPPPPPPPKMIMDEDSGQMILAPPDLTELRMGGMVDDFIVIAILRTNNEDVKAVCADFLFNLLHSEEHRDPMIAKGILWAVLKLAQVESQRTQRVGMSVLFNLSCNEAQRQTVIELGAPNVLALVQKQQTPETRRWAAAMMCNMSWDAGHAKTLVMEGALGVAREMIDLAALETDPCIPMYAVMLYNMAQGDGPSLERMILDGADALLVGLLDSTDVGILELACTALYNISCVRSCQLILADHQVANRLIAMLKEIPAEKTADNDANQPDSIALLLLGTIYNLTCHLQTEPAVASAGGTEACVKLSTSTFEPVVALCSKTLVNLALVAQNHARMVADGAMSALVALLYQDSFLTESMTTIALISTSPEVAPAIVHGGVLKVLRGVLEREGEALNVQARRDAALIFRNLSCSLESRGRIISADDVLTFCAKLLEGEDQPTLKLTAVGLYNLLVESNLDGVVLAEPQDVLTKIYLATTDEEAQKACALALVAAKPVDQEVHSHYSDGAVVALLSTMSTNGETQQVAEHGIEHLVEERMQPVVDFPGFEESSFARSSVNPDAIQSPQAEKRGHSEQAVWACHEIKATDFEDGDFEVLPKPLQYKEQPPHVRLPHAAGETSKLILKSVKTGLVVTSRREGVVTFQLQLDVDEEACLHI